MNQQLIRDIRERRQQLSEQIDAARKRGDHEAALDLTSEAWRLWQRLQYCGSLGARRRTPVLKFDGGRAVPSFHVP